MAKMDMNKQKLKVQPNKKFMRETKVMKVSSLKNNMHGIY